MSDRAEELDDAAQDAADDAEIAEAHEAADRDFDAAEVQASRARFDEVYPPGMVSVAGSTPPAYSSQAGALRLPNAEGDDLSPVGMLLDVLEDDDVVTHVAALAAAEDIPAAAQHLDRVLVCDPIIGPETLGGWLQPAQIIRLAELIRDKMA